eukprot:1130792-Prorocentrum_minimum.AAC.2
MDYSDLFVLTLLEVRLVPQCLPPLARVQVKRFTGAIFQRCNRAIVIMISIVCHVYIVVSDQRFAFYIFCLSIFLLEGNYAPQFIFRSLRPYTGLMYSERTNAAEAEGREIQGGERGAGAKEQPFFLRISAATPPPSRLAQYPLGSIRHAPSPVPTPL